MSEEIEIIEEVAVIEVEETSASGVSVDAANHAELNNLDLADQHPIKSIIGLKNKLDKIEALKDTQYAKGRGYAEYRLWDKTPSQDNDMVGRFVALVPGKDTVEVINSNNYNVFGVTIPNNTAALVGSDEWDTIRDPETHDIVEYKSNKDHKYALVCLDGVVNVYCTDIQGLQIGDYIIPGTDGFAEKVDKAEGYYRVINKGDNYVVINLSLSASDIYNVGVGYARYAYNYVEDGEIDLRFKGIDATVESVIDGDTIVGKAYFATDAEDYLDGGKIDEKFDEVDQKIQDIVDGETVVAESSHADTADNFIDGVDNDGKDIVRDIKEKFDSILNGETFAATLQYGQEKTDLNFIAKKDIKDENGEVIIKAGRWHPNPSGNYWSGWPSMGNKITETITLNDGSTVDIHTWQLKGMWIQDNDYVQILITPEKIFMRRLYNGENGFTQGLWMQIAGPGTKTNYALNADYASNSDKVDGLHKASLRGNETGFTYKYKDQISADNLMNEGHYFLINSINLPNLPEGEAPQGFLDVDYFDGTNFSPNGNGAEPITMQTFRHYKDERIWVRTYNHNSAVGKNKWNDWKSVSVENADNASYAANAGIAASAIKADKADKADEADYATKAGYANAAGSLKDMKFSFNENTSLEYSPPVGSILSLRVSTNTTLCIGYRYNNLRMFTHMPQYAILNADRDAGKTDIPVYGTWIVVGLASSSEDYKYYLIQKLE